MLQVIDNATLVKREKEMRDKALFDGTLPNTDSSRTGRFDILERLGGCAI